MPSRRRKMVRFTVSGMRQSFIGQVIDFSPTDGRYWVKLIATGAHDFMDVPESRVIEEWDEEVKEKY